MAELPAAIDQWESNITKFEDRSGQKFPEIMKMPVLMQMIPAKDLEQVLYKYRMNPEKDYARFSVQLLLVGGNLRFNISIIFLPLLLGVIAVAGCRGRSSFALFLGHFDIHVVATRSPARLVALLHAEVFELD